MSGTPAAGALLGRAPWTTAGQLTGDQRAFVALVRDRWSGAGLGIDPVDAQGRLSGPFDLMAASPRVGEAVLDLAGRFREGELTAVERELVILVVAALDGCAYMQDGHEPLALRAGASPDLVTAIRGGRPRTSGDHLVVRSVAGDLCEHGDLAPHAFEDALTQLGWPRLQEVVWLVGLYRALAMAMRVAQVGPAPTLSEG
ncbi:carboxymuconolactone decarboxylase family protein [Nocardioides carbamazepini]|uniref:carboxymuconolactone decarboxylase family protein n=1 Tax=Nocardioides carbamazepini TaxID=2854259 RepID=UPI002149E9C5|nr:carboxymuconolactone decarboxylase family protein [Nocardioides carbamazepini]MCR1783425.1 carboxymuconolactone decarboxylase family protein [Nocardioides carbamazepini]